MLLYRSTRFLDHETGRHPENAGRLRAIDARLAESGLLEQCREVEFGPADETTVKAVHGGEYLESVHALAQRGGGKPDADTVVCPASYDVARLAAGAVTDATRRVVAGEANRALCLVRPPGHHALADRSMGFCLINNIAVAARLATEQLGLSRVLIVDWDVHHGNGTQDIFYRDPQVGFFSIHRWPFYPGTGPEDETGAGDGLGSTCNLPIEMGTSRDRYSSYFARALGDFADQLKPELVLVSAGFDAHHADPIGSLGLETEDFVSLTQTVKDIAVAHAGGRIVSILEGGYNAPVLADCVAEHLMELRDD